MPYTIPSFEEKPYNTCLNCTYIGKTCDGPNFLAMSSERFCEWCKLRKEYLGWTNAHVAELAQVARVSVDRIMAGNIKDLRISTMQAVVKALVNGTWGQYPCAMAAAVEDQNQDTTDLLNRCAALEARLISDRDAEARKIAHLKDQIDFTRSEIKFKNHMLEQKNAEIAALLEMLKAKS